MTERLGTESRSWATIRSGGASAGASVATTGDGVETVCDTAFDLRGCSFPGPPCVALSTKIGRRSATELRLPEMGERAAKLIEFPAAN